MLTPDRAIGTDQTKRYVFVVGADKSAQFREVQLGPLVGGGMRIIAGGLKAGELVVVNGLQRVRPGAPVQAQVLTVDAQGQPVEAPPPGRRALRLRRQPSPDARRAMNISRFFIDRPRFAGVLSILIFLVGLIALQRLPISEYPEVTPPQVVVRAVPRRQPARHRRDRLHAAGRADQRRREHAVHEQPGPRPTGR